MYITSSAEPFLLLDLIRGCCSHPWQRLTSAWPLYSWQARGPRSATPPHTAAEPTPPAPSARISQSLSLCSRHASFDTRLSPLLCFALTLLLYSEIRPCWFRLRRLPKEPLFSRWLHYSGSLWAICPWKASFSGRALFIPVCVDSFTENLLL